jgi:hypothetical protein
MYYFGITTSCYTAAEKTFSPTEEVFPSPWGKLPTFETGIDVFTTIM